MPVIAANSDLVRNRWHVMDPIRFKEDLKVTIQALGWRSMMEEKCVICRCR